MAHILVGGDLRSGAGIRKLLQQWGMTCGLWPGDRSRGEYPTIHDCDALVLVQPVEFDPAVGPGASATAPWAPLILLGKHPGPLLLARDAQQVLADPGPGGEDLKRALLACLDTARQFRGAQDAGFEGHDREGYLHFLGHELRSPLTAAKTALEVLQGELGGLDPDDAGARGASGEPAADHAGRLKMLDIALRNVHRLQRTVDWSQDLLELEMTAPRSRWTRISVDSMTDAVEEAAHLIICDQARGRYLDSDPNLLRVLVGQMIRVFQYALPDTPLCGQVRLAPGNDRLLELELRPAEPGGSLDGPRIARTHLTPVTGSGECTPHEELERLVTYVVSRPLLAQLEAEVRVCSGSVSPTGLVLSLALAPAEVAPASQPAALHAPA